jgi:hypothetical protein
VKWEEHVERRGKERIKYTQSLAEEREIKRSLGRLCCRGDDNIKIDV